MNWFILLAILTQAGDAYTSCRNINKGFHEFNPFLGNTCHSIILNKSIITAGMYILFPGHKKLVSFGLIGAGGVGITVNLINGRNKF